MYYATESTAFMIGDLGFMLRFNKYSFKLTNRFSLLIDVRSLTRLIELLDLFIRQRSLDTYCLAMESNWLMLNGRRIASLDSDANTIEIFADTLAELIEWCRY